jgi:spore germination cell wall hydrolase CwlJ-like protein
MDKASKYAKFLYALVVVALILGMQLKISDAEGKDLVADARENEEILWLARVIYSETKRENEQVLVAWIVRNRVETNFRGDTYERVAKSPSQFSGLNQKDLNYWHNITRDYDSQGEKWQKALKIARAVYHADDSLRPFPATVRHFYSPRSVRVDPGWSADKKPVLLIKDNDSVHLRFAFYDSVK